MSGTDTLALPPRDLESLYKLARVLLQLDDYDAILDAIANHAIDALRAERGFLVLYRDDTEIEFKVVRNWQRDELEGDGEPISRSIVAEVLKSGQLMLVEDALDDQRYATMESVLRQGIRSVLAAPLEADGRRVGALYLESQKIHNLFAEPQRALFERILELSSKALERCLEKIVLAERNQALERVLKPRHRFKGILTQDADFLDILETVAQAAQANLPILIQGPTGTGKELVARTAHLNSPRAQARMVTVNCGAISPALLESELFGHVRGAFTDAKLDKQGLIAAAHGGTVFLDEVGELPSELQVKLLRTIQFGEVQPVGATRPLQIDARYLAATNRDLEAEVAAGKFRQDLLFRLNVITIDLPALRDRPDDILPLFYHFLRQAATALEKPFPKVSPRLERVLLGHDWPGNVRELENEAKRLVAITATGEPLTVDRMSRRITQASAPGDATQLDGPNSLADHEREIIELHLRMHAGNRTHAAKSLGISREGLRKKMKRLGLS